jgi:hypothetical protein
MPAKSEKQRRFFGLVRGVQSGKVHPSKVGPEVRKVAHGISTKDAEDFASSIAELKVKKAVLAVLKELHEPMYLNEIEVNPVAKTFNQTGKYEEYVKKFQGMPISPKEMEAITGFQGAKPTKIERTQIRFENTDTFNNSTTTVIKKLREGSQFVFTAFTKFDQTQPEEPEDAPIDPNAPPQPEEPAVPEEEMDEIVVTKSTSFNDDIKGGAILAEFLKKLDL